jgi:hypothetical protein
MYIPGCRIIHKYIEIDILLRADAHTIVLAHTYVRMVFVIFVRLARLIVHLWEFGHFDRPAILGKLICNGLVKSGGGRNDHDRGFRREKWNEILFNGFSDLLQSNMLG